jgi:hypothetical protein
LSFRPEAWFGYAFAVPNQVGAEESILTSECTSQTLRDALRYCYRTDVHRSSRSFRWISPFWSKTPASRNDELVRTIALTGRHHKIVIPTGWLVWRRGSGAEPGWSGGIHPRERERRRQRSEMLCVTVIGQTFTAAVARSDGFLRSGRRLPPVEMTG